MEEELKKIDKKSSKWRIWVLVTIVLIVAVVSIAYLWANKPYEKTIDIDSTSTETETDSNGAVTSACEKEPKTKSSKDNSNGPFSHSLYSATSTDGTTWSTVDKQIFDHASVPGAVVRDGVIYLYFVDASQDEDQLSVAISNDLGKTFEKFKVSFEGMASYDAVDPHPELVDGKIELFYLSDFMCMMNDLKNQKFRIYNAESKDGINFENQALNYTFDEPTTDPDVFKVDNVWKMLVSQGSSMKILGSKDRKEFNPIEDGFEWDQGGVSDTFNFDGVYRTFYCQAGIMFGEGADQGELVEKGVAIDNTHHIRKVVCDPSVIELPDKSYIMYYKTQEQSVDTKPLPPAV